MSYAKKEYWDYYEYCNNGDEKEYQVFYKSGHLILAYVMDDVLRKDSHDTIFGDNKDDLRKYETRQIFYDDDDVKMKNKSKIDLKLEELDEKYRKFKSQLKLFNDPIKIVYWGEEYKTFVEFAKENELENMNDLFNFNFKKLYKARGFNYVTVDKIVSVFEEWIKTSLLKFNKKPTEVFKEKENDINNLIEEFFY